MLFGNFIADHLKGPDRQLPFDQLIRQGIALHRHIDRYTDTHNIVAQSKARVRPQFGKYAPVIVDVFYDHFLAIGWSNFHNLPLPEFSKQVYALLQARQNEMPASAQHMLPFMVQHDWLTNYARPLGIRRVMQGMSRRTRFVSGMDKAPDLLFEEYDAFKAEFEAFFPELEKSCMHFMHNAAAP